MVVVVDAWLKKSTALPARSTQYCFPEAPSTYVFCSGNLRRWELKILPQEKTRKAILSLDKAKQRMARFVDTSALEFWRSAVYHFSMRASPKSGGATDASCWPAMPRIKCHRF